MSKTLLSLAAATVILGGLTSVSALAQTTPAKAPMAHHAMHHRSCYDLAWESQQQKDCLAGKAAKPVVHKTSMKHKKAKAT
jgi:hypothetical protein